MLNKEILKSLKEAELEDFFQKVGRACGLFEEVSEPLAFPFEPLKAGRTVFYPGSFSPWHKGHQACLLGLPESEKGECWNIVIAPDYNPWKKIRETDLRDEVLTLWDSLENLSDQRPDLRFHLYLGFLGEKKKNPTYEWMKKTLADDRWLLMGEDSFLDLDQWFESKKLLELLNGIIVVPREAPADRVLKQKQNVVSMVDGLEVLFLEHHNYEHFSSTFLREKK
ncbi:MAG: hypothetical protein NXH75_05310 [Halobacteriovoraceae bacterium]|nr:hypothetical protein [Halobacteriovoraceae bacterium]